VREQVALTVAEVNLCAYCLSAHTTIGQMVGLKSDAIISARSASAADPKTDAILKLARAIVVQRGEISEGDFAHARQAGMSEGEVAEVVANVALNIFTNYFNHVAQTDIDFPRVEPGVESTACATAIR
jgi:AhpD family alkylhydroperoxidase